MLHKNGINWNDYPTFFKRRSYIQKRKVFKKFTIEEIEKLPEKHEARKNPNLEIERTKIRKLEMPTFSKVTNREEVIFEEAEPQVENDE